MLWIINIQHYVKFNLIKWCIKTRIIFSSPQEKEMEKQKLLYQQARLHCRGASEMVLQTISASKGRKDIQILENILM